VAVPLVGRQPLPFDAFRSGAESSVVPSNPSLHHSTHSESFPFCHIGFYGDPECVFLLQGAVTKLKHNPLDVLDSD
jgi:hypothetical protein